MEIRKKLDDDEFKKFWAFAQAASREVGTWPAWKRGELTELKAERSSDGVGERTASTPEESSCK
jgi:hypothetical protein